MKDAIKTLINGDEVLNAIIDLVVDRLELYGVTLMVGDEFEVAYAIRLVVEQIKNTTNQSTIPEGLTHTATDMICGKFLYVRNATNRLEGFTMDKVLDSVKVGDATISFGNGGGPEDISTFIDHLMVSGRGDVLSYRKIKW